MPYAPASNTTQTPSITHLASVWYNREGLDVLRQQNRFMSVCEPDDIPKRSGKTVQWYRYSTFGANVNPSAEGVIGNGLALTTSTISSTVEQFSDFLSGSRLLQATAIDDIKANGARELSYRASISVDTICRNEFDSNAGAVEPVIGAAFTRQDVISSVAKMRGQNVMPKSDGNFAGILHPYITLDLMSDNTAGGFIELSKYTSDKSGEYPVNGEVGKCGGVRFFESTNVGTSGSAPNVLYNTYIVGKGAVGTVALSGMGPQNVVDPSKQSFSLTIIDSPPNPADPEGQIGFYVSYFFVFAVKTLDSSVYRYRILQPDASVI